MTKNNSKEEAMENMECWSTQNHLKECKKCAPVGNWKEIEEEFRKEYVVKSNAGTGLLRYTDADKIIAFFKRYFQEKMHEISLRELEEEHPLYKKEYNELPEIVDNNPKE